MKKPSPSGGRAGSPGKPPGVFGGHADGVVFLACVYLAGLTWLVFEQTLRFDFVGWDDGNYVSKNLAVVKGLSLSGIRWAFAHPIMYLWTPLTTVSHMADCQFFGLHPAGHHLTNVLLHMATVVLLFLVLRQMTGALWASAFVAAVFAIHPLRVESVAWIAERKDVLSGVFFMLTLGAYVRWTRKPGLGRYLAIVVPFTLGLLSKPMLVTLPVLLLLLDAWPLGRWQSVNASGKLLLEKLPLFLLSATSCVVTLLVGRAPGPPPHPFAAPLRLGNAVVSSIGYVGQIFYPAGLNVLYPFPPGGQPGWKVAVAALLFAGISAGVFLLRKNRPYLLAGWLWYLIALAPVSGILQMGREAHADRYTYLPQIGLYILITWAVVDWSAAWPRRREVLIGLAVAVLAALTVCARAQAAYWRDAESMWERMIACNPDNPLIMPHLNLGLALNQKGKFDEAIAQFQTALAIKSDIYRDADIVTDCHVNLGYALLEKGDYDQAIAEYQKALELKPDFATGHYNIGYAFLREGKADEAIPHFQKAIKLKPDYAEAHMDLGIAYRSKGMPDAAIGEYRAALKIRPDYAEAQRNLAALQR